MAGRIFYDHFGAVLRETTREIAIEEGVDPSEIGKDETKDFDAFLELHL